MKREREVLAGESGEYSRRTLFQRSGLAAMGAVLGGQLFAAGSAAADSSRSAFTSVEEFRRLVVPSIASGLALATYSLPMRIQKARVRVDFTEPRDELLVRVGQGRAELEEPSGESTSGIVLSCDVAHRLLIGEITTAFAVANRQIVLVGNRAELGGLHDVLYLATPFYREALIKEGKGNLLDIDQKQVV